jgi:sialate O-acetylesterase
MKRLSIVFICGRMCTGKKVMNAFSKGIVATAGGLLSLNIACAEVYLAPVFGSNMVLQRDVPARLVGWADAGETVVVKLGGQVVGNVVGAGKDKPWTIMLPVQKAGAMPDIVVEGKNRITLTNLLAGDVWVCSGQSNMEMSLQKGPWCGYGGALNAEQEVAAAAHPDIRFLRKPNGGWAVCSPESAKSFSAAGYFFGRELQSRLKVPIGLVQASVGGTAAELWTPRTARETWAGFAAALEKAQKTLDELKPKADADDKAMSQWRKDVETAKKEKTPVPPAPARKMTDEQRDQLHGANALIGTGNLYNVLIEPLTTMRIKGAIWYQGESNSRRSSEYAELMGHLIGGWRKAWGQADLPFLIMELVNFDFPNYQPWYQKGTFAELRGAQRVVAENVPNIGIAVGIDIGVANEIHPPNKQDVGKRLALVALKQVYGQEVVAAGPTVRDARFENGKVILDFDPGGKEQRVVFRDNSTNGFELAGADGVFVPAAADLQENTLVVTAPDIAAPEAVRYAWADNPPATLFNTAGLPAAPFQRGKNLKGGQ